MSVDGSEETNDTNKAQVLIQPKPYNRLSKDREETRAQSRSSEGEDKEANPELTTQQKDISDDRSTPRESENRPSNPFSTKLSPISDSPKKPSPDKDLADRTSVQTPAFRDKDHVGSFVESNVDSNDKREAYRSSGSGRTKQRGSSPFMVVQRNDMDSKRNSVLTSGSKHSRDASLSAISAEGDWKNTALKQVTLTNTAKNIRQKAADPIQSYDPEEEKKGEEPSDEWQAVNIVERTLDDSGDTGHLADPYDLEDENIREKSSSPDSSRSPVRDDDQKQRLVLDKLENANLPLSSRNRHASPMRVSSRQDDVSSGSEMRELKLALGGMSDRSGNGKFEYNHEKNFYEGENVIFSDEGSNDSFNQRLQMEDEGEDNVWEKPTEKQFASINIMRSLSLKMQKGDETDQAIQKVLQNLVKNFLDLYNPDSLNESNQNLTQTQKLEQKNQSLIYELATCLPFVKIAPGKYLVGTDIRYIQIKGRGVLVRTGGGYMYLSEYLLHYAKTECL